MTGLKAVRTLDEAALDEGRSFFFTVSEGTVASAGTVTIVISAPADSAVRIKSGTVKSGFEQMDIKVSDVPSVTGGSPVTVTPSNQAAAVSNVPVVVQDPTSTGTESTLFSWTEYALDISANKKQASIESDQILYVMKAGGILKLTFTNSGAAAGELQVSMTLTVQG